MPGELVVQTLKHVWDALKPFNVPMAVMGGVALSAWKHVRATRDVDLLIGVDPPALQELLAALSKAGIQSRRRSPIVTLGKLRIVQLFFEPPDSLVELQVDLMLAETEYHRQALNRRVSLPLSGSESVLDVLACEDLILHKLLAGRLIDRADVVALIQVNRDNIDWNYLAKWSAELVVKHDLGQLWAEAFPGEEMPFTSP